MKTKVCKDCGNEKDIDDFAKRESNIDGKANACKKCEVKKQTVRNKIRRKSDIVIGYDEINPFDWIFDRV